MPYAVLLYNDRDVADPFIKVRIQGPWNKYQTYLQGGHRRPLKVMSDWLFGGILRRSIDNTVNMDRSTS